MSEWHHWHGECNPNLTGFNQYKPSTEMHLLILFLPLVSAYDLSLWPFETISPPMDEVPENPQDEHLPPMEEVPEHPQDEHLPTRDEVPQNFKKEIVDAHNEFRRNVEPPASNMVKMTWNDGIAETAKAWAEKCTGRLSNKDERILNGVPCGEVMSKSTYALSWKEMIAMWYSKKSNFQYGIGAVDPRKDTTVYTQLIWYNTHEVGCAVAYCPDKEYSFEYVCRYCPAGNIVADGELLMPYRKGQPCGDCPNDCEDKLCTNPCKYYDKGYGCKKLLGLLNCNAPPLNDQCQATCNCPTEIV
ncbi:hypothetical protein lerEdw1_018573 [Lerista edwardsae]|nr:hypothetical protein lerEdw1_018573 [Lerista edwardsae]